MRTGLEPNLVTYNQVRGHCSFEMVIVTASAPRDRVLPKEYRDRDWAKMHFRDHTFGNPPKVCDFTLT